MSSVGPDLPAQLWQPRDVDGNPSRFILGQHLRLQRFGRVVGVAALTVSPAPAVACSNGDC
jgi:hypothetical protein